MSTLLERQQELHALRTQGAYLVEAINGKFVAWMAQDLAELESISGRLAGSFET
jgi:hypothetical protein